MTTTAAATPTIYEMGTFQVIPLTLIDSSKTNAARAKGYNKERLDELEKR